jgi:hypothetical protein
MIFMLRVFCKSRYQDKPLHYGDSPCRKDRRVVTATEAGRGARVNIFGAMAAAEAAEYLTLTETERVALVAGAVGGRNRSISPATGAMGLGT